MRYIVTRNSGKRLPTFLSKPFSTYEKARSAVRIWLRKEYNKGKLNAVFAMNVYRNANIVKAGYSIRKV